MGCMSVTFSRKGGMIADAERIGGISCDLSRVGFADMHMLKLGGMQANLSRVGGMKCRFSLICSAGIMPPYLEISPEILWVWVDPGYNDVYSNTNWNIN